ncbi:hypothetical protein KSA82_21190, partial [Acinetobacter baumannii]|nr:hypothetical protein [Acinetobacter baumannii]
EYFREAVASFLTHTPTLQKELASITVNEAENIGTAVEILRTQITHERFVEHTAQLGIDTVNLVLQFIDVHKDDKNQILKNYHQKFANSLNIDGLDRIKLNNIFYQTLNKKNKNHGVSLV